MSGFSGRERFPQRVESAPGLEAVDDLVSISMVGSCVSVGSSQPLDRARTSDVLGAMNGAIQAGSVVVIARSCRSILGPAPIVADNDGTDSVQMQVVGPGVVAAECEGSTWAIDMSGHRFLRGGLSVELCFVPAAAWIPFRGLWISGDSISACVARGSYVTARRSMRRVTTFVQPETNSWFHRLAS